MLSLKKLKQQFILFKNCIFFFKNVVFNYLTFRKKIFSIVFFKEETLLNTIIMIVKLHQFMTASEVDSY